MHGLKQGQQIDDKQSSTARLPVMEITKDKRNARAQPIMGSRFVLNMNSFLASVMMIDLPNN